MNTLRIIVSLVILGFMVMILAAYFDYSDLSWEANSSEYIALGVGFLILLSNGVSIFSNSRKESEG